MAKSKSSQKNASSGVARLKKLVERTVAELGTLRARNGELEEQVTKLQKAEKKRGAAGKKAAAPAVDGAVIARLEKARAKLKEENGALRRRAADLEKASKALEAEKRAALQAGDTARSALAEFESSAARSGTADVAGADEETAWQDEKRELRQRVESLVTGLEKVANLAAEASQ